MAEKKHQYRDLFSFYLSCELDVVEVVGGARSHVARAPFLEKCFERQTCINYRKSKVISINQLNHEKSKLKDIKKMYGGILTNRMSNLFMNKKDQKAPSVQHLVPLTLYFAMS